GIRGPIVPGSSLWARHTAADAPSNAANTHDNTPLRMASPPPEAASIDPARVVGRQAQSLPAADERANGVALENHATTGQSGRRYSPISAIAGHAAAQVNRTLTLAAATVSVRNSRCAPMLVPFT